MKSNLFNSVKVNAPSSNTFDLSHDVKFSCNMGNLVPVMIMDCIPGDVVTIEPEAMIRFAPMIAPIMHRVDQTIHYFFVPNRLVWQNWEKFITNTPLTTINPNLPAFPFVEITTGDYTPLCDYLGIPTPLNNRTENVSAIPFAAYQMIYNEYYRDQNLIPEVDFQLNDGYNLLAEVNTLRSRAWEHDYFTAALPFAQKGNAVDIPLGEVTLKPDTSSPPFPLFVHSDDHQNSDQGDVIQGTAIQIDNNPFQSTVYNPQGSLEVLPTTINDLRRAFRLQEWLEKAARGGSRYIENIKSFFGVQSSDKRLQRPEYITGIKAPVQISEVLNTSETAGSPQGSMAGHGISYNKGKSGTYRCEEHGYIIGIMSVLPKTAYQQGLPKHFLKINDPFEFFWPQFAHIGEQPVENREVYAFTAQGSQTFGYVPRYSEYKFMQSRVAGDFKTSLDFWHMGRIFASPPALNETFVTSNPTSRIFAVDDPDIDKLWIHVYNKVRAVRKMPIYGTPTF